MTAQNLVIHTTSPLEECRGLLGLARGFDQPATWLHANRKGVISGQSHVIDHVAVTTTSSNDIARFVSVLANAGCAVPEGPGLWPDDFCSELELFDRDLKMHFATIQLPSNLLLVLAASYQVGDQIDRFRRARGPRAIHHAAVHVHNLGQEVLVWSARGFFPLKSPVDDGNLCQVFLRNQTGQIIELIERRDAGLATFSCSNIAALRKAE